MSNSNNALIPRTGLPVRISEGPKVGQRSLYRQQVLDEDSYTEALSHIITRDFFPDLPQIHATNEYLTALTNNDPELLSSAIRRLAAVARDKEDNGSSNAADRARSARAMELENVATPYMSMPGGSTRTTRTPVGARGWDTPLTRPGDQSRRRARDNLDPDSLDNDQQAGPSRPKRKKAPVVRDDLPLDAFQQNYTSEDNASFVQIIDEENERRREEKSAWAWEAEKRANTRRIEGENKRRLLLDQVASGSYRVDANGKRLIGGLAEGGTSDGGHRLLTGREDEEDGETSKATSKTIESRSPDNTSQALVRQSDTITGLSNQPLLREESLPAHHPLHKALDQAGLPTTALVSTDDGAVVPFHEVASGSRDGRGRGADASLEAQRSMTTIMGEEQQEHLTYAGTGVDQWGYKAMNNLMFTPDANSKPFEKAPESKVASRQAPKAINHSNTRLPDETSARPSEAGSTAGSSRRGSSPARSWVAAAVAGTPYHPNPDHEPKVNNYSLLPNDPSPSPTELPSLLTWGSLLSTPRALDGTDDPLDLSTPSFRLPASQRRDEIGRKLGNKASKAITDRARGFTPRSSLQSIADKTRRPGKTSGASAAMAPPPATPRREGLTPAGRRLLERGLGLGSSARNRGAAMEMGSGWSSGAGSRSKSSMTWTPSPNHRHKG